MRDKNGKNSKTHECRYTPVCCCNILAGEPDERCPVHGFGPDRKTCDACGRFMPRESTPVEAEELPRA